MVFLYLMLFWAGNFFKTYSSKRSSQILHKNSDTYLLYTLRMSLCLIIGFCLVAFAGLLPALDIPPVMKLVSLFSGIVNALFLVIWFVTVQRCDMALVSIALLLGSVIPIVASLFIFKDSTFSILKFLGLFLLAISILLMSGSSEKGKRKMEPVTVLLLIANCVFQGFIELAQQLYKHLCDTNAYPTQIFSFYTYLYGFLTLLILFVLIKTFEIVRLKKLAAARAESFVLPEEDSVKGTFSRMWSIAGHILVMSVGLFVSLYFQTLATTAGGMPADVLYATQKGGNLFVSFALGLMFREKATRRTYLGLIIALFALVVINVFPRLFGL